MKCLFCPSISWLVCLSSYWVRFPIYSGNKSLPHIICVNNFFQSVVYLFILLIVSFTAWRFLFWWHSIFIDFKFTKYKINHFHYFHSCCTILTIAATMHSVLTSPHSHWNLLFSIKKKVSILINVKWYLILGLVYISLMTSNTEHLFTCLLANCISYWRDVKVSPLPIFKLGIWLWIFIWNIFSYSVGCLFILLRVSSDVQKFLMLSL